MSQFLAIDWSPHEVRFVLASGKGSALKVEAVGAVPLSGGDQSASATPEAIGGALREALTPHKLSRPTTLVGIGRSSVELHRLSLPPASDEELPVLVANQILREFSTASEASIVDFVADVSSPNQPRQVTAAVLSADQLEHVRAVCTAAGLTPHRIVLRPYAAAALYSLSALTKPASCLLVNVVDDEVDLTIVEAGKATFSRTVRFPQSSDDGRGEAWLYAEMSRTLLAAPRRASESGAVSGVCLLGGAADHQGLAELVQDRLKLTVETLDPFEAVGATESSRTNSGRFASLVGLLAVEARVGAHEIDFANPRRPPKTRNRKRPMIMAAAVVALAAVGYGYSVWDELSQADAQIADLKQQIKTTNDQIEKAEKKQVVVYAIAEWQAGDVVWLDELRDLSQKLPGSRDLTVLRMSMSPARAGGGVVTLQGAARSWTVVERMVQNLRDEFHEVGVPHQQGRDQDDARGWHFDTSIAVAKRDKAAYLAPPAESVDKKDTAKNNAAGTTTVSN